MTARSRPSRVALARSAIVTAAGSFRLLAVPEPDCEAAPLDREPALRRTIELMHALPLETAAAPDGRRIEDQWTDDDGEYRRERRHVEQIPDLEKCRMSEHHIEPGAQVCVFGEYSAAKQAIVADPHDWSKIVRIMKGDPGSVVRQLEASVVRRTLGALAAIGIAAALVSSLT